MLIEELPDEVVEELPALSVSVHYDLKSFLNQQFVVDVLTHFAYQATVKSRLSYLPCVSRGLTPALTYAKKAAPVVNSSDLMFIERPYLVGHSRRLFPVVVEVIPRSLSFEIPSDCFKRIVSLKRPSKRSVKRSVIGLPALEQGEVIIEDDEVDWVRVRGGEWNIV